MALASLGWKVGVGEGRRAGFRTARMGAPGPGRVVGRRARLPPQEEAGRDGSASQRPRVCFVFSVYVHCGQWAEPYRKKRLNTRENLGSSAMVFGSRAFRPGESPPAAGKIDRRSSSLNEPMISGVGKSL